MEIIEFINDIFNNSIISMAVSVVGVILTIYFSIKVNHKRINYSVCRKGNKYILAFWNTSNRTIFGEDLYYFYAYGNVECECKTLFNSDTEVMLNISLGDDQIVGNRHVSKISFNFDFLNKRNGYIVGVFNKQKDNYIPAKFKVYGRIRGENKNSICPNMHLYEGENSTIINNNIKILSTVSIGFAILSLLYHFLTGVYVLSQSIVDGDEIQLILSIFICTMSFVSLSVISYTVYNRSMPYKLKRIYNKYLRENDFDEVKA